MAVSRTLYGFETGAQSGIGGGTNCTYIQDGTARTGCSHGRTPIKAIGGGLWQLSQPTIITLAAGEVYSGCARIFLRLTQAPDKNSQCLLSLRSGATTTLGCAFRLNSDLTWDITYSTATTTGGTALSLNQFYEIQITCTFTRNTGAGAGSVTLNGQTLNASATNGGFIGNTGSFDRLEFGAVTVLNGVGGDTLGMAEWDDAVLIQTKTPDTGLAVLPSATRIRCVPVTAQGASAGWTGNFSTVQEIPRSGGSGQTSAGAGLVTTFSHQAASALGIASVTAWRVYAYCTRPSSSSTENIRLNGVDYPVTVSTTTASASLPTAVDWSTYTPATFDGAEFGMVNSTGASLTLDAIHAEVLYQEDSRNWFLCGGTTATGAPPFTGAPDTSGACVPSFGSGTDSGGGSGCQPAALSGSDSGGGSGCQESL